MPDTTNESNKVEEQSITIDGTLQAEIASIQSDLAMLCNKCILTMTSFKTETQNIISLIIQCHSWLMDGEEGGNKKTRSLQRN